MRCPRRSHASHSPLAPDHQAAMTQLVDAATGSRPEGIRRTATVVFTDLADSTAQRIRLGESLADRLRRVHDDMLVTHIEEHSGLVVKCTGDGIHACFDSSIAAIECAIQIQIALEDYSQSPSAIATLRARIGIAAGDVLWASVGGRPDCFGLPVIEAARLVTVAKPAEIICSPTVRLLARELGSHGYEPIGPLTLKGFNEPTNAFRIAYENGA